jgi:hypothetical protein
VNNASIWLEYFLRLLIVLFVITKLARYGYVIAAKTRLEGVGWVKFFPMGRTKPTAKAAV